MPALQHDIVADRQSNTHATCRRWQALIGAYQQPTSAALLICRHELDRMREASSSPSKEDIERQQLAAQQQADAELAKAQERTNRMLEVQ